MGDKTQRFRVMSFNLRGDGPEADPTHEWAARAPAVTALLRAWRPDLIGFQEVMAGNLATLAAELAGYEWALGRPGGPKGETRWNAIAWRGEAFELVEQGGFYLSETPELRSRGWDGLLERTATWALLAWRRSEQRLLFVNTHLDHRGIVARREGSCLILDVIEQRVGNQIPVVVTGDVNQSAPWTAAEWQSGSADPLVAIWAAAGYREAYLAAGQGDERAGGRPNSFHGFEGAAFVPWDASQTVRLDWILVREGGRPVRVCGCTLDRQKTAGVFASDHYPLVADLGLV